MKPAQRSRTRLQARPTGTRAAGRRAVLVLAAACGVVLSACAAIGLRSERAVTLVWYGLARQGTFQSPAYVALEDGISLAGGDGVQLFLTVKPSVYVYVLHQTVSGEFAVWWPAESNKFNALVDEGRVQTLPARGRVFTMELTQGVEAIYVIASRTPVNQAEQLTRELQWLFVTAQALAAEVPPERIRGLIPRHLAWGLDLKHPNAVGVVDQRVPYATTVRNVGRLRKADEQWVTTAEGGTYGVQAEQISGNDIVARVIRLRRTVGRGE